MVEERHGPEGLARRAHRRMAAPGLLPATQISGERVQMKRPDWHYKSACAQAKERVRINEAQRCVRIIRAELAGRAAREVTNRIVDRILDRKDSAEKESTE